MSAFQAEDGGSIPLARSKSLLAIWSEARHEAARSFLHTRGSLKRPALFYIREAEYFF
jgi:hypothetical protein